MSPVDRGGLAETNAMITVLAEETATVARQRPKGGSFSHWTQRLRRDPLAEIWLTIDSTSAPRRCADRGDRRA
jgi:glucose/arabinose dehydrogenase